MSTLKIGLREGFENDEVVVRVNGREVFRRTGVTSNLASSYAATASADILGPSAEVEVEVPQRGMHGSTTVQIPASAYVYVTATGGQLRLRALSEEVPAM